MRLGKIPKRPKIPLLLKISLILWASSATFYNLEKNLISIEWIGKYSFYIIILCILLISILLIIWWKTRFNLIVLCICIIIFSFVNTFIFSINTYSNKEKLMSNPKQNFTFCVEEDQKTGTYTNNCNATIQNTRIRTKLQLPKDFEETYAGDTINADINFSLPNESQELNYWQNGITLNAKAQNAKKIPRNDIVGLIYSYRNYLCSIIRNNDYSKESHSYEEQLLNAIVCGQRIDLNESDLYDSFKCSGLAHLVAVSGAHLSLITSILLVFLKRIKIKKNLIIILQSVFIFCFLICSAIPISALRAAFMAYITIFSYFSKRRPAPLNALGLCIVIFIAINPTIATSISFTLSAGSTMGIMLFSRFFEYYITRFFYKCPKFIKSALSLTFASSLCSQPLSISIFSQLPLIAPISNIVCTPIFTILCATGLFLSVLSSILNVILPSATQIVMFVPYSISFIMVWSVNFLSSISYSSIPCTINLYVAIFISLMLCVLIYGIWPKTKVNKIHKKRLRRKIIALPFLATFIFLLIFVFQNTSPTQLIMLDIGQGDSIVLKSKGKTFMIDTGNQDNLLKTQLAKYNIYHLDGILITHPDDDHCGSLDVIEQLVDVSKVYVANDLPSTNNDNSKKLLNQINKIVGDKNVIKLKVGDVINFGEIELQIIWPDKYTDSGGNCDSLTSIASIDIGNDGIIESRVLLCGDAEKNEISNMLKLQRIPKIDIYKCGHHGSKNAINENDAKIISPKISLISVGAKNRYGHPAKNTLQILENAGSKIYRTDINGSISCNFNGNGFSLKTEKQ